MKYYIIRQCGDYSRPNEVKPNDGEVYTCNGRNFVKISFTDENFEEKYAEETVYTTKKEAWKVILKRIDDHIANMQVKREKMFAMALEDDTFKQSPEEFTKWLSSISNDQEANDLFGKRNKLI